MKQYFRTLSVAGSDSGGGAGIQADLKTFAALGCYGMSVITALTAQNTRAVSAIHPCPPEFIAAQLDAVLGDIGADAVKIGMLHDPAVIDTVAGRLKAHGVRWIVLDPVMVAKSGDRLLREEAIQALRERLLPLASLITPNLPEAATLLGQSRLETAELASAARRLADLGPAAVLIKGGHGDDPHTSSDLLYHREGDWLREFSAARIDTPNTHGTGCTLSAAIAACLARGSDLAEAVMQAKQYLSDALRAGAGYRLGGGHGPVHHFFNEWR